MAPSTRPEAADPAAHDARPQDYGESVVIDLTDAVAPRALLEAFPDPVILGAPIRDRGGAVVDFRLLYLNAAARALQPRASSSIGSSFSEIWSGQQWQTPLQACLLAAETGALQRGEVSWTSAGGVVSGYTYQAVPAGDDTLMVTTHDVSDRLREARARTVSEQRFRTTFDASPAAMVLMDEAARWLLVSPSFADLLATTTDALTGRCFADFIDPPDQTMVAVDEATLAGIRGGDRDGVVSQRLRAADGRLLWSRVHIRHVPHNGDFVAHILDVTDERRTLEGLEYEATHDALTGLPNRRYVIDRLARAIAARGRGARYGVLFLDLDDFKEVNDRFGHGEGDRLLREVADRLLAAMRPADVVARLGGDEFVVVCEGLSSQTEADLLRVAERIRTLLQEPPDDDHRAVSCTIGIAVGDAGYTRPEQLLESADKALYVGKRRGGGRPVTYDPWKDTDPSGADSSQGSAAPGPGPQRRGSAHRPRRRDRRGPQGRE